MASVEDRSAPNVTVRDHPSGAADNNLRSSAELSLLRYSNRRRRKLSRKLKHKILYSLFQRLKRASELNAFVPWFRMLE